jgi:F-type H+-transporting ATPase subunit alpha
VISIFAVTNGYWDDVPVSETRQAEQDLLAYMREQHGQIVERIRKEKKMDEALTKDLRDAIEAFKKAMV